MHGMWDKLLPSQGSQVTLHAGTCVVVSVGGHDLSDHDWPCSGLYSRVYVAELEGRIGSGDVKVMQGDAKLCVVFIMVYGSEWLTVSNMDAVSWLTDVTDREGEF